MLVLHLNLVNRIHGTMNSMQKKKKKKKERLIEVHDELN